MWKGTASDYNKLTKGVKTTTIIIYKERLRIYNRQHIVFYKFYLIMIIIVIV